MSRAALAACLLNARGDYLLNLPALRALSAVAGGDLILVVRTGARETFLRDVAARAVVEVDAAYDRGAYRFAPAAVAAELAARGGAETFVSLNPWGSPLLDELALQARPERSIGLGEGPWTDPVALDFGCHSSELAFRAALVLDPTLRLDDFAHAPAYPPDAQRFARELRDEVGAGPLSAFHRDSKPGKEWSDERWVETLLAWTHAHPSGVAVDVGLAPLPERTAAALGERVLHGLGLPLAHALAVTGVADLFVGVDSCFLHAADLARVPAVGLFFETAPAEFGLRWARHRHLVADGPSALDPGAVLAAIAELSAESAAHPRVLPGRATAAGTSAFFRERPGPALAGRRVQGLTLGTVGLGTARFGFDRELAAVDVLRRAFELGCNVVDLAGNHGGGDGCAVVGRALARALASGLIRRDQVYLCGKAGFTEHLGHSATAASRGWRADGHCLAPDFLAWELDRQRRWLGVAQLDAFLIQNPEEHLAVHGRAALWAALEDAFRLLEGLVAEGDIGAYGVSTAEALRVPRTDPRHIDLADLAELARAVGGDGNGFRVLELPVGVARLEALDVPAHRAGGEDPADLPALRWAERAGMIVLASAPLGGGAAVATLARATSELFPVRDPAAQLLELARSAPGVTCALVGITTPSHLGCLEALLDREPADLEAPVPG